MSSQQRGERHLRLVSSVRSDELQKAKGTAGRDEVQLSFPYPDDTTVFFAYVEMMRREEFSGMVRDFVPRWIFDVRTVPRLDTIAVSRMSAFRLFESAKLSYVDLFGRLGIKSYRSAESNPAIWGRAVASLIQTSERRGPYIFLFDDTPLFNAAQNLLPAIMKPIIGKRAQFAVVGTQR